ncbi:ABC transporter permease [Conexibacter arvalis]|uniref:Ribose/xylose/arabinose/galactoside ABC-type transport system permease subunit n=1 Tax=Conexibacter arvalis TaxID=912552 RepID=A0A840IEQ8_9ACTN|nr:ABC transporter permease [Conexibacter arvalis]MBB4662420.1 ribose/xylose/arabinose/galactoside ABC-type transport system permease subunit [Conexibacter arvalis]
MTAQHRKTAVLRLLGIAPVLLLVALLVVFGLIDGRVVDPDNLRNVAVQAAPIALLALGAHVVLLSGGIDLSAGFAVGLCAVVIAQRLTGGDGLLVALLVGLAVALAVGAVNGLLVGYAKLPPFVATLATMVMVQGATLKLATSGVLLTNDPTLRTLGVERVGPIPVAVVATAVVGALMWAAMRGTRFGIRTGAIGSDADAARFSGVDLRRQQLLIYVVSALMVLACAVLVVSRTPVVTPNVGGVSLLLDAIAAAVIGGTSIFGGRGTVGGVLVGALIIALVTNALRVFGVDPSSLDLYKGTIIVIALLLDAAIRIARSRVAAGVAGAPR